MICVTSTFLKYLFKLQIMYYHSFKSQVLCFCSHASLLILISSFVGKWRYIAPRSFLNALFTSSSPPNTVFCILFTKGVILQTNSRIQLVSSSEPCSFIRSWIVSSKVSFLALDIKSCKPLEFFVRTQAVGSSKWYCFFGRLGPAKNVDICNDNTYYIYLGTRLKFKISILYVYLKWWY